jgi:hypothetical protein
MVSVIVVVFVFGVGFEEGFGVDFGAAATLGAGEQTD